MVIPTSFELFVFRFLFHLSWIYWYKNVNSDSSVLCFALRSGQTECTSIRDSPLELELCLKIQPSTAFSIRWFQWCILICTRCIVLLFCCKLWYILYIYIVASWTTISFTSAAYYYSVSVILWIFIYRIYSVLPNLN